MGRRQTWREKIAAQWAAPPEDASKNWRVVWWLYHLYFRYAGSLSAAEEKRDQMIAENTKPIPSDYYDSEATVDTLDIHIEQWRNGRWERLPGSERSTVANVRFLNSRRA